MLVVALLFNKIFCGNLKNIGFEFSPNDPCVATMMTVGKKNTMRLHVDEFMSIHVNPKVNDNSNELMSRSYGKHDEVKAYIGK